MQKKPNPPVVPILMTPEFIAAHPYVLRCLKQQEPSGEILSRFASLFCAAQTVLYDRKHAMAVTDERTGYVFDHGELMDTKLSSVPSYMYSQVVKGRVKE